MLPTTRRATAALGVWCLVPTIVGWWPAMAQPPAAVHVTTVDGAPVAFANVHVGGSPVRIADSLGVVTLDRNARGPLRLRVLRLGFQPQDSTYRPDEQGIYSVVLTPLATELQAVTVSGVADTPLARTGFYERMRQVDRGAVVGEFITPEELDQRDVGIVSNMLFGRRYVTVRQSRFGQLGGRELKGRGGCQMTLLVDGRRVSDAGPDNLLTGREVMAIEIYPSGANAPSELITLTGRGSCGIVSFWTGPRR